ncbi:MAG TPA: hypothetical protein VFP97_09205 [Chitinophagaceae bacterium]|nr:hypothetical protein [Chitinophagaceae bacterium]
MSYSFEQIRELLKKYSFEENVAPPKLVVAGRNFLDIGHKKRPISQFIIGVKEYFASEQLYFDQFLDQLESETGSKPLSFTYEDKKTLEIVLADFEDYFDVKLSNNLIQRLGAFTGSGELQYRLVIVVIESDYYYEDPRQAK